MKCGGLAAVFLVIWILFVVEAVPSGKDSTGAPVRWGDVIFLIVYPAVLVASGYAGVRRSSRPFLAVFAVLAFLPALLFTLAVVFYLLTIPTYTAQDISDTWEWAAVGGMIAIVFCASAC